MRKLEKIILKMPEREIKKVKTLERGKINKKNFFEERVIRGKIFANLLEHHRA